MRAVELREEFGLGNLSLTEREDPRPGPGEVLLEMAAASLNYRDLLMVQGSYDPRQELPLVPCSDGVGVVEAVGEGVGRVAEGDRVTPIFAQGWLAGPPRREHLGTTLGGPLDGTLRERMVVSAEGVSRVPDHLDDEEAACLPCAATTAWNALVTHGALEAGQTVLIQGTGGVALFALQLAVVHGARVIITSSRDEKLERARELGAWEGINYRETEEWGKAARKLTGGRGVDLVVELGGAGTLQQSLAAVRPGGRIALIGVLSGTRSQLDIIPIVMGSVRVQGVLVGHRESYEAMLRAIGHHRIHPVVDRVFPLEETRQALEHMEAGRHFGKIVVRI